LRKSICFDLRWQVSHPWDVNSYLKMYQELVSRVTLPHFVLLVCLLHETHLKGMTLSKEKSRQRLVYVVIFFHLCTWRYFSKQSVTYITSSLTKLISMQLQMLNDLISSSFF
jgi:hypothetical protein